MAKVSKKIGLLQSAKAAIKPKSGPIIWLASLKHENNPNLVEILDLIDDWVSGRKEFTNGHSRASLARFFCEQAFCDRTHSGMVDLLRRCEHGEVNTKDYR